MKSNNKIITAHLKPITTHLRETFAGTPEPTDWQAYAEALEKHISKTLVSAKLRESITSIIKSRTFLAWVPGGRDCVGGIGNATTEILVQLKAKILKEKP